MDLTLFHNATLFDGTSPESPEGMFAVLTS